MPTVLSFGNNISVAIKIYQSYFATAHFEFSSFGWDRVVRLSVIRNSRKTAGGFYYPTFISTAARDLLGVTVWAKET